MCVFARVFVNTVVVEPRHSPGATHPDRLEGRSIPSSLLSTRSKIPSMLSTLHADSITTVFRAEGVLHHTFAVR